MAATTVRIKNYRETMRALKYVEKGAADSIKDGFKLIAMPLAEDIRQRLNIYQGISLGTIGPKLTTKSLFVTQRARKRTGQRPDFGSLQMTHGFLPAVDDKQDAIEEAVERTFDHLADRNGF